ncbi:cell surface protein [uncultured Brachyspira sp.]|uniref:cell surface protein n=1 Tax=uncultured Brachyspira sp. TaxID=221953 RepID=UPI002597D9D4|nr:cell surface protein [uncultured Brachyspira sp.]
MKKIFLTTIALLSMASASVFGMYGPDSDWITFLTDGNRFRARADQLGFTLGNDTIKGTFGFRNKGFGGQFGKMLNTTDGVNYNFNPTISMGLGYTSSLISVGVGYNATISTNKWTKFNGKAEGKTTEAVAHTPVLVLNAMDNAFRMAIPIQVVNLTDKFGDLKGSVTAVSLEAQFRYYTGLDFLPQIRLYLRYGNYDYEFNDGGTKEKVKFAETFGFDFRLWFGSMVEEVAINPIIKIQYNGALGKQHNQTRIQAADLVHYAALGGVPTTWSESWAKGAWDLKIIPALGITANSDIVSLYVEPSLGLQITQKGSVTDNKVKELYSLYYGAYAEIYITPLKNLEWYFEVDLNNGGTTADQSAITFASTTGITWYLPAL